MSFRKAVENQDIDAMGDALAENVVFRSPAVHAPYEGRETVKFLLSHVLAVFEDFHYVDEMRDGDQELLRFACHIGDRQIDGIDLIRHDADGKVAELTVFIRPLSGLNAVQQAMSARLEASAS